MKRYSHNWCKKKFIFAFTILCEGYSYLYPAPFHSKFLSSNYWEKYASFLRFCAHFFIICAPSAHKIDSLEYLYPAAPQPFEISKPVNFWKISVGCCCVRLFKYFFTIIHRKKKRVYLRYTVGILNVYSIFFSSVSFIQFLLQFILCWIVPVLPSKIVKITIEICFQCELLAWYPANKI